MLLRIGRLGIAVLLLSAPAAYAWAQRPDHAGHDESARTVAVGGELTAVISPSDEEAYFNYTNYERNALRLARGRLFGEWHLSSRLSAVGELRLEDGDAIWAPALYLRWQPLQGRSLTIQAGRIPPVIGAYGRRAYGRDEVVIGQPLAYQYLTALRPDALPTTTDDLLKMRGRGWLPSYPAGSQAAAPGVSLLSSSRWDTGVQATVRKGTVEASLAMTQGSPAVPVVRENNDGLMAASRLAIGLRGGTTIGLSAARAQWVARSALELTLAGRAARSAQSVLGVDAETGVGRWLVRGEMWHAHFDVPLAGSDRVLDLGAWTAFLEGRYRLHPRWHLGGRLEGLTFSRIAGAGVTSVPTSWDAGVKRVEFSVAYRTTRQFELRAGWQYNWRDGGRVRERGFPAFALLYWF